MKTLKELEAEDISLYPNTSDTIKMAFLDIRQEAIKWLGKERTLNMNAQDFILVFFGITEEDLK